MISHEEIIDDIIDRLEESIFPYKIHRNYIYGDFECDVLATYQNTALCFEVKTTERDKNVIKARQQLIRIRKHIRGEYPRAFMFECYGLKGVDDFEIREYFG